MTLTQDDRIAWGQKEFAARKADMIAVHAGTMSLAEAQKNARERSWLSGMSPASSDRAYIDARRIERRASEKGSES